MLITLYKRNWKAHWKLLAAIQAVIALYFAVITGMYDPADGSALKQLVAMKLPEAFIAALGFSARDNSLLSFLASYLYGFLLLALPLIPIILLSNRLIAALVDRGAMASLLSSAVTRRQVALTQALFLISAVMAMALLTSAIGILMSEASFPGLLDQARFWRLNGGLFMALLAVSAVCFFFSCLLNESRLFLPFGAGLPVMFLILRMLINYDPSLKALKWLTLFSLFVPADFTGESQVAGPLLILGAISLALYAAGILAFDRKDLPL